MCDGEELVWLCVLVLVFASRRKILCLAVLVRWLGLTEACVRGLLCVFVIGFESGQLAIGV